MPLPPLPQEEAFHVNQHGVLAIPGLMWAAFVLLARQWVLLVMVGVSTFRGQTDISLLLGEGGVPWGALAAQAPVLLLANVAAQRFPTAGAWARWVWRWGREIVALAALLNLAWTILFLWSSDYWMPWPELFLACCSLLDLAIVLALFTGPYYRQLFNEFPSAPTASPVRSA